MSFATYNPYREAARNCIALIERHAPRILAESKRLAEDQPKPLKRRNTDKAIQRLRHLWYACATESGIPHEFVFRKHMGCQENVGYSRERKQASFCVLEAYNGPSADIAAAIHISDTGLRLRSREFKQLHPDGSKTREDALRFALELEGMNDSQLSEKWPMDAVNAAYSTGINYVKPKGKGIDMDAAKAYRDEYLDRGKQLRDCLYGMLGTTLEDARGHDPKGRILRHLIQRYAHEHMLYLGWRAKGTPDTPSATVISEAFFTSQNRVSQWRDQFSHEQMEKFGLANRAEEYYQELLSAMNKE